MVDSTCIFTARAINMYGIEVLVPENANMLQKAIDFEIEIGKDKSNLSKLYKTATDQHPHLEMFWL